MEEIKFSNKIDYNLKLTEHVFKKNAGNLSKHFTLDLRSKYIEDDLNALSKIYSKGEKFVIFGECTNLYVTEGSYQGLFIKIEEQILNGMDFDPESKSFSVKADSLLKNFVCFAAKHGYDFSVFYGIPGLVGSAVCGNSGSDSIEIGKYVKSIKVYNIVENKYEILETQKNFFFARNSYINEQNKNLTKYIILECTFKADYLGKAQCEKKIKEKRYNRKLIDRDAYRTAGSFWVSSMLPDKYRSKGIKVRDLMKEIGLNTLDINGAKYVTEKCFLTTSITTRDSDVAALLDETIKKLQENYGFTPKKEVIILDYDGKISVDEFIKRYKT
jgi:UDP-N-acetylenolpyruvoylglucosamine reductase